MTRRTGADGGDAAVEVVVLAVVLVVAVLFVVFVGRISSVEGDVDGAAADAARAASLRQDPSGAATDARATAAATLTRDHISCAGGPAVGVDTSAFGAGGTVAVDITCVVELADVAVPGMPGSKTVHATSAAAVDTYRSGR